MKAYKTWNKGTVFWVSGLKGKVGDWEYSRNYKDAIDLNKYWQRRFAADCKYCGDPFKFVD